MAEISKGIIYTLLFTALYFEVLLLLVFLENHTGKKESGEKNIDPYNEDSLPSTSIIVPCYNEETALSQTVNSLLNLDYPQDRVKIILVDDGSMDSTYNIAKDFEEKYSRIYTIKKENGGKHTAINAGLEYADTHLVGCLDADSFVHPSALKEIIPYFTSKEVKAVTPAIKVWRPQNTPQLIQSSEYMFSIFIRRTFSIINALFVTPGPFSIFKKEIFNEVGAFKPAHNTEDLEMCMRIQSKRYKVGNAHQAIVYTNAPKTIKALFKQRVRWTYGFLKNTIDYRYMILRPSYGPLGMFVLPMTIISIFSALFFAGYMAFGVGRTVYASVEKFSLIGFEPPNLNFDLFFWNTDIMPMIIYTLILLTIGIVFIGKKISCEQKLFTKDILFYIFLYGIVAPFWLARAVYDTALSRKGNWAAEHDSR